MSGSSSNTTLVPTANIVFGGTGANRTVTVTPAADQSGSTTITVIVSDGVASASDTFTLTVTETAAAATAAAATATTAAATAEPGADARRPGRYDHRGNDAADADADRRATTRRPRRISS